MSEVKRYSFWPQIVHLPGGGGVRAEVHFKVEEDGLFVAHQDYARLKAEVERLTWLQVETLNERNKAEAEVERLRASSFVTAVPVEEYEKLKAEVERLRNVGDEMATLFGGDYSDNDGVCYDKKWNAAKEGRPNG